MNSSGGGGGPVISHQKQVWTSPHKEQVLPGGHPQQDFNQGGRGKNLSFCLFFFNHTKMLHILNLLTLSALLVKGRKLQGCSGR